MLFFTTRNADGEEVLINADLVFAFQKKGKTTVAFTINGFAMELGESLAQIQADLAELD